MKRLVKLQNNKKCNRISPWSNQTIAPLQAAGTIIPLADIPTGRIICPQNHGTVFFISKEGFFLTAGHVCDGLGCFSHYRVLVISVSGVTLIPVVSLKRHPDVAVDLAIGQVDVSTLSTNLLQPLTLSSKILNAGDHVAVLGYPRNEVVLIAKPNNEGYVTRLRMTPDFYEGDIEDFYPNGFCLVKSSAYMTNIISPPSLKNLSGASGGPLVTVGDIRVFGVLSTASEQYSLCTSVQSLFGWKDFENVRGVQVV